MPKNLDWKEGHTPNIWVHGPTGIYSNVIIIIN